MEHKLPLGILKQAAMKMEAFISDIHEAKEDQDVDDETRQELETMAEVAGNLLSRVINITMKEIEEEDFIRETMDMDELETYPESKKEEDDIMAMEI